jgi:putative transposase
MANTYTQIFIHAIFVVKGRLNLIPKDKKDELYKYITGIIQNKHNKLYIINGMPDHIHILFGLNPDESLSSLMKEVKRVSSLYINKNKWVQGKFEWQAGYGAFSYSKSQTNIVCKYIANQEKHHKIKTFREEYIELLKKFEVEFDMKYIFEDI